MTCNTTKPPSNLRLSRSSLLALFAWTFLAILRQTFPRVSTSGKHVHHLSGQLNVILLDSCSDFAGERWGGLGSNSPFLASIFRGSTI